MHNLLFFYFGIYKFISESQKEQFETEATKESLIVKEHSNKEQNNECILHIFNRIKWNSDYNVDEFSKAIT